MSYRHPEHTICPDSLERCRVYSGMSRKQLAQAAGVTKGTIYNIERKKHRPRVETMHLVAEALGVPTEELLEV
jgi:DNA-binding XRE family transcriptional regulator